MFSLRRGAGFDIICPLLGFSKRAPRKHLTEPTMASMTLEIVFLCRLSVDLSSSLFCLNWRLAGGRIAEVGLEEESISWTGSERGRCEGRRCSVRDQGMARTWELALECARVCYNHGDGVLAPRGQPLPPLLTGGMSPVPPFPNTPPNPPPKWPSIHNAVAVTWRRNTGW